MTIIVTSHCIVWGTVRRKSRSFEFTGTLRIRRSIEIERSKKDLDRSVSDKGV